MTRLAVEVPEEVAALLEKEPLLRLAITEVVKREVTEYLPNITALDKLTEDSKLTEKDIQEISKLVKRAVREKWDAESSS